MSIHWPIKYGLGNYQEKMKIVKLIFNIGTEYRISLHEPFQYDTMHVIYWVLNG